MPDPDPDAGLRVAAFQALDHLVAQRGPVLPWSVIAEGFSWRGQTVCFANRARGIFRPKVMKGDAPLSIRTSVPRKGRQARYDDQVASSAGYFVYRFQGRDPTARDNQMLRVAFETATPIIYFYGVAPALYRPLWPVFVTGWYPEELTCHVAVDFEDALPAAGNGLVREPPTPWVAQETPIRRRYATVEAKRRLHQDAFRRLVLDAYRTRCAICGLALAELLDAAHILPDRDERGRPEVPNGLALCNLHHRAFDRHVIGIRPDHVVEVSPRVLREKDGPVFHHAILAANGARLRLPRRPENRPRSDFLASRYEQFRAAS